MHTLKAQLDTNYIMFTIYCYNNLTSPHFALPAPIKIWHGYKDLLQSTIAANGNEKLCGYPQLVL